MSMKAERLEGPGILGGRKLPALPYIGAALLGVVALLPVMSASLHVLHLGYLVLLYSILALSWNLMAGFTGYISFGHGMFFGIGMYTSALLLRDVGWNPWLTAPLAGLVSAMVAGVLGLVCLRLRGPYFAIVTLAFSLIFEQVALNHLADITGGGLGIFLRMTSVEMTTAKIIFYCYALVLVVALLAITWRLPNSRFGMGLVAIRENEAAAEASGVPTTRLKVLAFILSAAFPGMAGAIHAYYLSFIDPALAFDMSFSVIGILSTVLGGIGTLWGPALGAAILTLIAEWIQVLVGSKVHHIAYGLILVGAVLLLPAGLLGRRTSASRS